MNKFKIFLPQSTQSAQRENLLFMAVILLCISSPGWAQDSPETLQKEIKEERLKELDTDVESQAYMIADWEKYRKEVEKIRQENEEEKKLETELKQQERH